MKKKAIIEELSQFAEDMEYDVKHGDLQTYGANWIPGYALFLTAFVKRAKGKTK